jgi:hypothetical protein
MMPESRILRPGGEVLDQREDAGGDALRKHAAAEPQSGVHRLA